MAMLSGYQPFSLSGVCNKMKEKRRVKKKKKIQKISYSKSA